mmetsp:Transcript_8273/g.9213  ORF Transcript_8273/g.9213 Transcript_8273/m.9213 type:complete len:200 (+) Transcript_8273:105-704(+)
MEADDLDSLIADSLSGVQAALDGDRKAPAATDSGRSADQAVRELQQGVGKGEAQPPGEDFFKDLVKTLQDENFQKAMAEAMQQTGQTAEPKPAESKPAVAEAAPAAPAAPASTAVASSSPSGDAEDFLQNFMRSCSGPARLESRPMFLIMSSKLSPSATSFGTTCAMTSSGGFPSVCSSANILCTCSRAWSGSGSELVL